MTPKELSAYAEQERKNLTEYFSTCRELPKLTMGCEKLVDPDKFVSTNLDRIGENPKSREVIAAFRRLKRYKQEIERL